MPSCIDCGKDVGGKAGTTICLDCASKRASALSPEQLMAMARLGMDAVADESSGFQDKRPAGDLKKRYKDYLKEEYQKVRHKCEP